MAMPAPEYPSSSLTMIGCELPETPWGGKKDGNRLHIAGLTRTIAGSSAVSARTGILLNHFKRDGLQLEVVGTTSSMHPPLA
jgi:hypothetical protein